ncbi:MoaD family protein [Candidatus Bathyarchaeota archaeon]|nr:MoaD family protein [Candidatus Bathyarchaeota archaeon]
MAITVKFVGAFRHFSGTSELILERKGCISIGEMVNELVIELPMLKKSLVDKQLEDLRPNALILVNSREIGVLNGLETKLNDGDQVTLVPVMHGG